MKAMLLTRVHKMEPGYRPLVLQDMPAAEPAPGEMLIRVLACGVCHTELDEIEGRTAPLLSAGGVGYRSLRMAELQDGQVLGFLGFGASAHLVINAIRKIDADKTSLSEIIGTTRGWNNDCPRCRRIGYAR